MNDEWMKQRMMNEWNNEWWINEIMNDEWMKQWMMNEWNNE